MNKTTLPDVADKTFLWEETDKNPFVIWDNKDIFSEI